MSERHACRVVKQPRGTQRYRPTQRDDEDTLTQAIVTLASQYGRYGYRRITALLRRAGWQVGKDRVERIWRREGLKVPQKQKARGRLWLNDGSCVRLRPQHANHVWSYDFVSGKTHDGRTVRMLNLIDEHTRESLLVRPERIELAAPADGENVFPAQVLRDRFYGATRQIEVATGSGRLEIETAARDHFANVRVPRDAIQFLRNN